ncbi:MAG: cobalt ECF transporter T component CbiQ [Desulfobulbus sp.]|nr:cobalt ECF transporter T component CbiQ [Desulfobulbus sp.]
MNLDQAQVIVLNGVQSLALMSCLFLPFFLTLVVWLLKNDEQQAGGRDGGPDWSIPTLDLHSQGQSLYHSWAPAVKIAALLATSFLLVSLKTLTWAFAALLLCALAVQLTGMPWKRPLKRLAALIGFLCMLVVILPLTSPVHAGDTLLLLPWLKSWPLNLAGVFLALTIVCKAAAVALLMEPMLATSSLSQTLQGFTDLGLPSSINQMILLCHRYIFVFQAEMQRMQRSMRVRGFVARTNLATLRTMGNGFGMLFIRSFERTERVYEAMLSRGYQGGFPGEVRQKITSLDLVKGALFIMVGVLLLAGERLLPIICF